MIRLLPKDPSFSSRWFTFFRHVVYIEQAEDLFPTHGVLLELSWSWFAMVEMLTEVEEDIVRRLVTIFWLAPLSFP